jgi:hypothetical protein
MNIIKLLTVLSFLSFFVFNATLYAQEAEQETEKKPIQLKSKSATAGYYSPGFNGMGGGFSGGSEPSYTFRVGNFGIEQKVSYFGDNLKEIVKDNPDALAHMNTFAKKRKNMVTGYVISVGGVVLAVALGAEKTGEQSFDPRTGQSGDKYAIKPIGIVGIGVALTGIIVAGVNGNGATKYVERAVKAYNKDLGVSYDEEQTVMKINFNPIITPDFVGAGFKLSLF